MSRLVHILICGLSSAQLLAFDNKHIGRVGSTQKRLDELNADEWNRLVSGEQYALAIDVRLCEGSAAELSLVFDSILFSQQAAAAQKLRDCPAFLFFNDEDPLAEAWQTFPPVVASLSGSPTPHLSAITFDCRMAGRLQSFLPGGDPLWGWLNQAVRAGCHLNIHTSSSFSPVERPGNFPELAPKSVPHHDPWVQQQVKTLDLEALCGHVASHDDAVAVQAGLFQMLDYLDESHELSQSVEGRGRHRGGDYWHAINHRREPDDANSKYWFRQVGSHPIFAELALRAHDVLKRELSADSNKWIKRLGVPDKWDPFAFVDLCSECRHTNSSLDHAARRIQFEEMLLLMDQTLRDAVA